MPTMELDKGGLCKAYRQRKAVFAGEMNVAQVLLTILSSLVSVAVLPYLPDLLRLRFLRVRRLEQKATQAIIGQLIIFSFYHLLCE
jgi:hypothetical protein